MASPQDVIKMVKENDAKFVDFRFTDTRGKEQHVTVPVSAFDEDKFENGHAFDGSSIAGWKGIQASDMQLMPDPATAYIDPFFDETTLVLTCDVVNPADGSQRLTLYVEPYHWFGEIALIDQLPRSQDAVADIASTVRVVSRPLIEAWLDLHPQYWRDLARLACSKLRLMLTALEDNASLSLE